MGEQTPPQARETTGTNKKITQGNERPNFSSLALSRKERLNGQIAASLHTQQNSLTQAHTLEQLAAKGMNKAAQSSANILSGKETNHLQDDEKTMDQYNRYVDILHNFSRNQVSNINALAKFRLAERAMGDFFSKGLSTRYIFHSLLGEHIPEIMGKDFQYVGKERVQQFVLSVVENSLPRIEQQIREAPNERNDNRAIRAEKAAQSINYLGSQGTEAQHVKAVDFFVNHMQDFYDYYALPRPKGHLISLDVDHGAFKAILAYGTPQQKAQAQTFLEQTFSKPYSNQPEQHDARYAILASLLTTRNEQTRTMATSFLGKELQRFGIASNQAEAFINQWNIEEMENDQKLFTLVRANLETMEKLHKKNPEAVFRLHDKYKIFNFGRYPDELLLKQLAKEPMRGENPYGIVATATFDHNNYNFKPSLYFSLDNQMTDLDAGHDFIFTEARSVQEMEALIGELTKNPQGQPPVNKPDFLMINIHGNEDALVFNPNQRSSNIHREDAETVLSHIRPGFADKATLFLLACESGRRKLFFDSFINIASRIFNGDIIGLSKPDAKYNITVSKKREKLLYTLNDGSGTTRHVRRAA